jgi:hypothetical protein
MTAPLIPKVSTLAAARTVSQTAHGFTAGQTIYRSATAWALAKSDALTTLSTGVRRQLRALLRLRLRARLRLLLWRKTRSARQFPQRKLSTTLGLLLLFNLI